MDGRVKPGHDEKKRPQKSTTRAARNEFCFPKNSPARFPASRFRKSSQTVSFNNPYGACPACAASASSSTSTKSCHSDKS